MTDLVLLLTAASAAADARVREAVAAAGFTDVRDSHGFVFQHLLVGPERISDLAAKLGMTPQGASKLTAEMERAGYVRRVVDPGDQRNRLVELAPRGRSLIEAGRAARAAVDAEFRAALGSSAPAFESALHALAEHSGGLVDLLARRLRPRA
ncbi:MarR family transcriptional regulator [Allokutzneria sp. A3M-2-11 16]|uniref:MarR family winged helix-turn-helix transcriptional regulator n=1 Tax=Allokutzneria sp. A3M-2-11 16 TaxID=2962043 RepID=UPI0020B8FE16|nr:MarR family transcriptional regulator [Allokutzneria sp. A3M-2-11 16]MCP3802426.1 MarR family transcriptional regulator [Allokutzneria sp. A3M-2-11 16]